MNIKQIKTGRTIGLIKLLLQHVTPYVQYLTLIFSGTAAFNVIFLIGQQVGINIPFWVMIVGTVVILLLASLFEYMVSFPSFFAEWNKQTWEHDNPIKKKLEDMEKQIAELKKIIEDKNERN